MTQREGTAFFTPPHPAALCSERPSSRAGRAATCLTETRKVPPLALPGGVGAPVPLGRLLILKARGASGRRLARVRRSLSHWPVCRAAPSRDWTISASGPPPALAVKAGPSEAAAGRESCFWELRQLGELLRTHLRSPRLFARGLRLLSASLFHFVPICKRWEVFPLLRTGLLMVASHPCLRSCSQPLRSEHLKGLSRVFKSGVLSTAHHSISMRRCPHHYT